MSESTTFVETAAPEERLRRRLSTISNLPTPPLVFSQITKVINDPGTSVKEVANIMAEDPAMSAKVLRLANSAYFGARQEITYIRQAVMLLGLDAVKSMVLSSSVFDMFKKHKIDADYQERFWRHSLATALAARLCIKTVPAFANLEAEVAFSAGLLHDLGKLVICCFMIDEHQQVVRLIAKEGLSDHEAERQVMGYAHPLIGSMLAENWKLPGNIVAAIANHHEPDTTAEAVIGYEHVVHLANYLALRTFEAENLTTVGPQLLIDEIREQSGLTEELLEKLGAGLLEAYSSSTTFMQMAMAC